MLHKQTDTELRPVYKEFDILQTGDTDIQPVYKERDILQTGDTD
jgi:hypothetical protein